MALATATGCGKSEDLSKGEPSAIFKVALVEASFPELQRLSQPVEMRIRVRNVSDQEIPDLVITVDSFNYRSAQAGLADRQRPVWIVESPPPSSEIAQTNSYGLGPLGPNQAETAVWKLRPVRAGTYTVKYKVAAGLTGKAKARLPDGSAAEGAFIVKVSSKPRSGFE